MRISITSFMLFLLVVSRLLALDIIQENFTLPGEDEPSQKWFLKLDSTSVMLPAHLKNKGVVTNEQKTVVAINFHGLSNYDGVDLVVAFKSGKVLIIPNIWPLLKKDLVAKNIIPQANFDHTYLEVAKIDGDRLIAQLHAVSAKDGIENQKKFSIFCIREKSGVKLCVVRGKGPCISY